MSDANEPHALQLDITWDPAKAQSNIVKHIGPIAVKVRIISAREASKRERQQYENEPR